MHQPSAKFPNLTKMPKKVSWLSVDPSQVVAVPFSPRPIPSSSVPTERVNCQPVLQKHQSCKIKIWPMKPSVSDFIGSVFPRSSEFLGCQKKYWCCKNGNGFFHLQWMESLPNLNPFGPPFRPDVHPALLSLPGRSAKSTSPENYQFSALSSKMVVGRWCSFLGARPFFKGRFWVGFREGVPGSENLQSSNLQCLFQQRLLRHRRGLNFELKLIADDF